MTSETPDLVLRALAGLSTPAPDSVRADQVKARCQRVLDERRRQRTSSKRRSPIGRVFDATCFLVVGIYLAEAVREAVRLGGFL
jgi:hypothetical protein